MAGTIPLISGVPNSMARIAIYMPGFYSGGVERQHLRLAPQLAARGHDVSFVVHEIKGSLKDEVPPEFRVTALGAKRAMAAVRPLARFLKAERPDILVANMGHPNLIALLASRIAGEPSRIIASQHNHLTQQTVAERRWQHKILPFLYRRFLHRADAIVAVSAGVADDLARVAAIPRERISVIYNPAVPENIDALAAEPVNHPWLVADREHPVVLAIGRLVAMKDLPTLLKAIAALPDVRLIVLGEGPMRDGLAEEAMRLGISERVDFIGFQANPYAYLRLASAFVLSSRYEGFANVVAEALACGIPVVSTDCPSGPSEILDNGAFGRLVPVGDSAAMASALADTLSAPVNREALRERGKAFSVRVAADAYDALFSRLLAKPK